MRPWNQKQQCQMCHPKPPTQLCHGSAGTFLSWSSDSPALGSSSPHSCPKLPSQAGEQSPLSLPSPSARGSTSPCAHWGAAAGVNHRSILQTLPSSVRLLAGTPLQLGFSLTTAAPEPLLQPLQTSSLGQLGAVPTAVTAEAPGHRPAPAHRITLVSCSLPARRQSRDLFQREQQDPVKFPARAGHQQCFGESRSLISCSCRNISLLFLGAHLASAKAGCVLQLPGRPPSTASKPPCCSAGERCVPFRISK